MPNTDQPAPIVRQKSPLNVEYPFSALSRWLIPADQFYVRNHFPTPNLDERIWRLAVTGAVRNELTLDLPALQAMPGTELAAVMECAGNGRVFYEPPKEGLQWQTGAVGNALWSGVLLREVLARAGVSAKAVEVVLIGADRGVIDAGKKTASPGPIAFARSLPLAKAMSDSALLAYAMNDEPLGIEHGFPLRAAVGGWYGMAWVKWLVEIRVVERPFTGYWQARDYIRWDHGLGEPTLAPLTEMEVKAQIAQPVSGAIVHVGQPVRIFGAAWAGEAGLAQVLVSTDERTWQEARLLGPATPFGWRLWDYAWTPPAPGHYGLRCRAIDATGATQPDAPQPDREGYAANWIIPIPVQAVVAPDGPVDDFVI
ncbi:sulfite oxidase [Chelatococcus sp. GCM10030263]|uniref:sulfite oxidase n=1 Tax=Chelatococcus sp. GCM10030263 TaxID=3273387 RepID=UPI00360C389E